MRRILSWLHVAVLALLALLAATEVAGWLERSGAPKAMLARGERIGLDERTVARLRALPEQVVLTYFVTPELHWPAREKHVPRAVADLLARMHAAAPDHIDVLVLDPDAEAGAEEEAPPGHSYAARKGASPFKVRKVLQDAGSEVTLWSSLVLARGRHRDALLQGVRSDDLPWLAETIVTSLEDAAAPRAPVIALAGPEEGFAALEALCQQRLSARVLRVDFDEHAEVPPEADVLVWVAPRRATAAHAAAIERLLARGRSVLIAASTYAVQALPAAEGAAPTEFRVAPAEVDWSAFLHPFGLELLPLLTFGDSAEVVPRRAAGIVTAIAAPFHLRFPASLLDLRHLLARNVGSILVGDVSPIAVDREVVERNGFHPIHVATTQDGIHLVPFPADTFDATTFAGAPPNPKQPWFVQLQARSRWRGDLLLCGAPLMLHDDVLAASGHANARLLQDVLRTYTTPERLARAAVPRPERVIVPETSPVARLAWRLAALVALPLAWLLPLLARARSRPRARRVAEPRHLQLVPALVALVAIVGLRAIPPVGLDASADGVHTPLPRSRALVESVRDGLSVELVSSAKRPATAGGDSIEARVLSRLRALGLAPRIVRPEALDALSLERLRAEGITPFLERAVVDDTSATVPVWSALRLTHGDRVEVVRRLDSRTVEHVEFLVAAACQRLVTGAAPVVGILSDLPRLSPAEAHADFQEKGLTAPVGDDVFRLAKELLADHGYELVHIRPDAPRFPAHLDALVWLQPRFSKRAWPEFTTFLAEGGRALVALQHYNVQQRQYRGSGFRTVYWPQPQFHGFNELLQLCGLDQLGDKRGDRAGEVLFDRQHAELALVTQVNRSAGREHDTQQVALPFLIRAAGDGLSRASVVTRNVGDLLYPWAGRFIVDSARLAQLGLRVEPLVTTSERAWNYSWSGGWIPESALEPPVEPSGGLAGPQLLAALVQGSFPRFTIEATEEGREQLAAVAPAAGDAMRPGALILNGCSEMWKDPLLHLPSADHDRFLLNTVALLVYGEELAAIQAHTARRPSLPWLASGEVASWRTLVLGAPLAALLVALAGIRALRRRQVPMRAGGVA